MHLLYFDESGSPQHGVFTLGGLAIHEAYADTLARAADGIVRRWLPRWPNSEIHAQPIRTGSGAWRRFPPPIRRVVTAEILDLLTNSHANLEARPILFGVAVERRQRQFSDDVLAAHQELLLRCGQMLLARQPAGRPERCLAIGDHCKFEMAIQLKIHELRSRSAHELAMSPYLESPVFIDSRTSRLIQLADFVSYWTFRAYEANDDAVLRQMLPAFERSDDILTGLIHLTNRGRACGCLACQAN